jgi:hypothetical protein
VGGFQQAQWESQLRNRSVQVSTGRSSGPRPNLWITVAIYLHEQLPRLALIVRIDKHRSFRRVVN